VASRPDWCISRQRSWGVPIPAFYDRDGAAILDARVVSRTADLVSQIGSNVWFEKSAGDLWAIVKPADWTGPDAVARSADTLDVWIDSGSSSRSVLMRHPELSHEHAEPGSTARWQADIYLEGSDQHRGWFQSSLLLSLAGNGAPPYRAVLTHGFMVDADREKISKSKQSAYEKPQTAEAYVKKWGADIVRLWVASQDYRNDIIVSEERVSKVAESYRLLRNTLRYQLSNLYDFDPIARALPLEQLTGLDRWILSEFSKLEQAVIAAYDAYEFHVVYQRISQFAAVELSAIYHDVVKDRLYTDPPDSTRRRSTQNALHRMVHGLCRMLAPILAFTADETWECVPPTPTDSVHLQDWQPEGVALPAGELEAWTDLFELRALCLPELERVRQEKLIGKALEARLILKGPKDRLALAAGMREELRELLNVSQLDIEASGGADPPLTVAVSRAPGDKCERCWHWETTVGSSPAHPTLCDRCVRAVGTG
jgi:isoleucyl-tRNA synthetase